MGAAEVLASVSCELTSPWVGFSMKNISTRIEINVLTVVITSCFSFGLRGVTADAGWCGSVL